MRAIPFGTIIMFGALGETVTEKSGNLNLGVPGIILFFILGSEFFINYRV
ncbi:MAG: ABC transporter permease, partial [Subdoligranulum sp.]|nr:ABC transporter permease [Subdoligranulum sp.]